MGHSIIIRDQNGSRTARLEETHDIFGDGDLEITVSHSSLNYKDAMALDGNPGVVRTTPLVPGIDAVGVSDGQLITVNGAGLGERRHGGYTPHLRVDSAVAVTVPERFTAAEAAAIGTAGYTAALSVDALRSQHVSPDSGEILVTGATGGVGSVALHLLHRLGYTTVALTGRREEHGDYLRGLGAADVVDRAEYAEPGKPLQRGRWAGVVDTLGSHTLVNALAQTQWGGAVTACGMAQGTDVSASVMPFILRGVRLIGINSVDAPLPLRQRAWDLLAAELDLDVLASMTEEITLDQVIDAGAELLAGKRRGRTVVKVQ